MNKEDIRTATRPVLLVLMLITSFGLIYEGIDGFWVDAWIGLTLGGIGEWVAERPLLKIAGKA